MATDVDDRRAVIAGQNDLVRAALANPQSNKDAKAQGLKWKLVWTPGIDDAFMQTGKITELARAVAEFEAWDADNDPYKERDFASLEVSGNKVFFKIDYYNLTLDGGSEDPADPAQTMRVITLMLPSEY